MWGLETWSHSWLSLIVTVIVMSLVTGTLSDAVNTRKVSSQGLEAYSHRWLPPATNACCHHFLWDRWGYSDHRSQLPPVLTWRANFKMKYTFLILSILGSMPPLDSLSQNSVPLSLLAVISTSVNQVSFKSHGSVAFRLTISCSLFHDR